MEEEDNFMIKVVVFIGHTLFRDNNSITCRMCEWFIIYIRFVIVLFSKCN